ncbi:MAG: cytochrome c [Rhodobacteraceae bacterium]|nr:cytochrome c [Paracoccaceae bacterium]
MRRAFLTLMVLAAAAAGIGVFVTRPKTVAASAFADLAPDLARGEMIYYAAGCGSCHAAPDASDEAKLVLAGGKAFQSQFGTFYAPNISSDPQSGIGGWSDAEIISAVKYGTSPEGEHYYPAFPYTSYQKAELADLVSLTAFLRTLPTDPTPSKAHEVGFPFNIRLSIGGWKLLFSDEDWIVDVGADPVLERGRYLAESLGHCGECHTPRGALGGLETARWFAGAPNPSGKGRIPNISPAQFDWSHADTASYLKSGFTPEFDVAGGSMTDVVASLSQLPDEDLAAIAAYVKSVPPAQ